MENSTSLAPRTNTRPNTEEDQQPTDSTRGTMSPQRSPTLERSPSPDNSTIEVLSRPTPSTEALRHVHEIPGYLPDRHNNNAPQALNLDVGDQNIITEGRRSRAPPVNYRSLSGGRGRGRGASYGPSSTYFTYYRTFATALHLTLH
jgi:hypothetical protein